MTAEDFYKKHLAYDNIDLDKQSPLTHNGVIHILNIYSEIHLKAKVEAMKLNQLPKCKCHFKNKGYHDNGCNYAIKYNKLLKQ